MNRLFDESIASMRAGGQTTWTPAVDAYRLAGRMVVTLELPGLDERDVTIEARGGVLKVKGRRGTPHGGRHIVQIERGYGTFERAFPLPKSARPADRQVHYEDGVLRIEIPL